jgi:hypothetical protein
MIKANDKMVPYLFELIVGGKKRELSPRLKALLNGGIIEEDGCWFLAKCRSGAKATIAECQDRTGLECFVNKVHIDEADRVALLDQGIAFVDALRELLESKGHFNIIMGVGYSDYDDHPNILICNVRFHQIRAGEALLASDLNTYSDEGLLVVNTELTPMPKTGTA